MNYIQRAQDLKEETVAHRRYFHTNAEVGLETLKAVDNEPAGRHSNPFPTVNNP